MSTAGHLDPLGCSQRTWPKILNGLAEYDTLADTFVVVSGITPDDDEPRLVKQGADAIFGPGASMDKIVEFVHENAPER